MAPDSAVIAWPSGIGTFTVANYGVNDMVWTAAVISEGDWLMIIDGASGDNMGTIRVKWNPYIVYTIPIYPPVVGPTEVPKSL